MDGLTDEERCKAWLASWHPSFTGTAILKRDCTFLSANPQFCKILGVTPAELIGQRFQDITPISLRKLDESNAQLVIDRVIESYILPKSYEFPNGRKVYVILLVKGVYDAKGEFLFFVSTIMTDESKNLQSPALFPNATNILEFAKKYGRLFVAIGAALFGLALALLNYLNGGV